MIYFGANSNKMRSSGVLQGKLGGLRHQLGVCYARGNPKSFEQLTGVDVLFTCSISLFVSRPPLGVKGDEAVVQCRVLCDNSIACAASNVERQRASVKRLLRRSQLPPCSERNNIGRKQIPFSSSLLVWMYPHLPFCFVVSLYRCPRKKFFFGAACAKFNAWARHNSFSIQRQRKLIHTGLTLASRYVFRLSPCMSKLTNYSFCSIVWINRPQRLLRSSIRAITWQFLMSTQNAVR